MQTDSVTVDRRDDAKLFDRWLVTHQNPIRVFLKSHTQSSGAFFIKFKYN